MSFAASRDRVLSGLEVLFEVSRDLRAAMLARDTEQIQEVVARQAEIRSLVLPSASFAGEDWKDDPEVVTLANRLHRLQESNRVLAAAFLGIYRKTLAAVTHKTADPGLYGRSGTLLSAPRASMLVQQTG